MGQRTTLKRHAERAVPDEAQEILASGIVAHLGFAEGDQPVVIPLIYQYSPATPDRLYLHGSHASRAMKRLATGAPVCVTVTLVDQLVYSREAKGHSANYRSVVCFGRGQVVKDLEKKRALFENMTSRYHPGRTAGEDYKPASREDLMSTAVIEVQIEEMSAKARRGGPLGTMDSDPDAPGTAGVKDL